MVVANREGVTFGLVAPLSGRLDGEVTLLKTLAHLSDDGNCRGRREEFWALAGCGKTLVPAGLGKGTSSTRAATAGGINSGFQPLRECCFFSSLLAFRGLARCHPSIGGRVKAEAEKRKPKVYFPDSFPQATDVTDLQLPGVIDSR